MEEEKKEEKIVFADVKKILHWYWKLTKQHGKWFWAVIFAYGAGTLISDVLSVVIYKEIIDAITGDVRDMERIWSLVASLIAMYLAFFVLFRLGDNLQRVYHVRATKDLSNYTFRKIQEHSYEFFSNRLAGALTSQGRRFIDGFINVSDAITFTYWMNFINLVGIIVVVAYYSWLLALLLLVFMCVTIVVVIPLLKRRMEYDAEESEISSRVSGYFSDVISNILTAKIFASTKQENKRFEELTEEQAVVQDKAYRAWDLLAIVQNGMTLSLRLFLLAVGIYLWSVGKISAGTIVLIFSYSQSIFGIAWQLVRSSSGVLRSIAQAKEMTDVFEKEPDVLDPKSPEEVRIQEGKIVFSDISFSYGDKGDKVFSQFHLKVEPRERLGLVGPSGGGKTTITKLLLRFIDPQSGEIMIDGQNIRNITQDDLRKAIAYVPQEPLLFHRSLRENIAYGKPEATDEEVIEAAKKAHAHEFIEKLEKGYDTMVGERGVKLSGGQRQRVAIARAILKDAPILVLDEATSALDTVSEMKIRQALDELMKEKTAIIIAHRLSTVEKLDRIIVLNNEGAIEEEGTHTTLVAKDGLYAELWRHQSGGFLDDHAAETEEEA